MIEAGLLLCLVSIVLAVFVPTFLRRVRTNKINEAAELLQDMSAGAAAYYATSWGDGKRHCLPPAAGPTPSEPTVDSREVDFVKDPAGGDTWRALGFQPDRPVRYSYSYLPSRDGCALTGGTEPGTVIFRAEGDLDGDLVRSRFERQATVEANGLSAPDTLRVHQRIE